MEARTGGAAGGVTVGGVVSVNLAVPSVGPGGDTGIDKRPVPHPVLLTEAGVDGDAVFDRKHHGRWFQAAYAFDSEELDYWSQRLGRPLTPGNAGENLTLAGTDCSDAVLGSRWRIGDAVLRVTGPRQPCRVFAWYWDRPRLIKEFTARGRTGAYLAVERAGTVLAGDPVEVLHVPAHGVTIAEVFAVNSGERGELAHKVRGALADLPPVWAAHTERLLPVP